MNGKWTTGVAWLAMGGLALADEPPGYYDGTSGLGGESLRQALHDIIDDHQRFPYTSSATDTWDIVEDADEHESDPSRVRTVYRNTTPLQSDHSSSSGFNREHCWPKSYGFSNDNSGNYPYTDAHSLRAANWSYNSSRSNRIYDDAGPGATEYPVDGVSASNWGEGSGATGSWETWSGSRGDVARSILYMDVRYEGGFHGVTGHEEPDLIVTDDRGLISSSSSNFSPAYMGVLSTLLQWHLDDPVDQRERDHNDVVYSYQGNRNPFVDHPEWVDAIWGSGGGTGGGAEVWINEFHYDDAGSDANEGVEIAGPAGTDLGGWSVVAYNGNGGSSYLTISLSGTLPDQDSGYGTLWFARSGLQNGAPDGLALVDDSGAVVEFLSYEGSFTAVGGPAGGASSTDVGVAESSSTPNGFSLQRTGTGSGAGDFGWEPPMAHTRGLPNTDQSFSGGSGGGGSGGGDPWINELHYDNGGTDQNEGVEIAGPAGTSLTGWSLVAYNGNGGGAYKTTSLSGSLPDQQSGYGTLWFAISGLQNGAPDGLALVDDGGAVVQFLSYEGSMTASDGPAQGLSSTDIGVAESSSTGSGQSLQLGGSGSAADDFSWQTARNHTRGSPNQGQGFGD